MSVEVVTFGCRLNVVESEAIRRGAEAALEGETIVFNTCAVTGEAISLDDLRYWSVVKQEPYASAEIAVKAALAQ